MFAADAVSRLSGVPGVAIVTAGPGQSLCLVCGMVSYEICLFSPFCSAVISSFLDWFLDAHVCFTGLTNTVTAIKNAQMAESPVILLGGAAVTLLKVTGWVLQCAAA